MLIRDVRDTGARRWSRCVTAWVFAAFAAIACTGHAGAATMPSVGETISSKITVEGFAVPLPSGQWTVYYVEGSQEGRFPTTKVGLAQIENEVVVQTVYVRVERAVGREGFVPYPNCSMDHYFHAEVERNQAGAEQNCWHIRAEALTREDDSSPRHLALFEFAKAQDAFLPVTEIGARFHMATREHAFRVSYNWNPDYILRPPAPQKVWVFPDWAGGEARTEPRKVAVLNALKRWAEDWYPAMTEAFAGRVPS